MADVTATEYKDTKLDAEAILGRADGTDAHKEAAKNLRAAIQKEPVEDVLAKLKEEGMAPVTEADIDAALERVVSADKDLGTGMDARVDGKKVRTLDNKIKYVTAREHLVEANTILKDFKDLHSHEKSIIYTNIQNTLKTAYPDAAAVMASASTEAERDEVLSNIFMNPAFSRALHGRLEGLLNKEQPKVPAELADRVANARRDFTQADIEFKAKDRDFHAAEHHANEFNVNITTGGAKQRELETLEGQKDTLHTQKQQAQREFDSIQVEIDTLQARFARLNEASTNAPVARLQNNNIAVGNPTATDQQVRDVMKNIRLAQGRQTRVRERLDTATQQLEKIDSLKAEKEKAQKDLETAEKERAKAKADQEAARNRLDNAQIEYDEAKLGVQEAHFLHSAETIIPDSVRDYLAGQVTETNDQRKKLMENAAKEETDKAKKELDEKIMERWHRRGRMNKRMIKKDMRALLISDTELRKRLKVTDDKAWEEKKTETIQELLGYRLNMGPLPPNVAWMLFHRHGKELFEHAESKRQEFRDWNREAIEKHWIPTPGWEGFKKFAEDHPTMIGVTLALLGLAGAQVFAPGWTAAKLAAAGKPIGEKLVTSHFAGTPNPFR